jgi:hypothetical protein
LDSRFSDGTNILDHGWHDASVFAARLGQQRSDAVLNCILHRASIALLDKMKMHGASARIDVLQTVGATASVRRIK